MLPPAEQDRSNDSQLGLDVDLVRELSSQRLAMIVDDDEDTVSLMKLTLRRVGINVASASSGEEALRLTAETHPDIILLDIMMPGIDGWETLKRLKHITSVPVVIISAILHEDAVVRAFAEGALDYIKKPYSHKEIVARIQAILSRSAPPEPHRVMVFPNSKVVIDLESHLVMADEQPIKLTPQEYVVLTYLAQNANRPVPYEELAGEVWGEFNADIRNRLKWVVHSLRKKLAKCGVSEELISNYQRFGYLLQDA